MIYAITGAGGFIGKALTEKLVNDGHVVYPIKGFQLANVGSLREYLLSIGANKIFHLAAYGNHYNQTEEKEILRVNILYTLNLFKASGEIPVINFSTSSVTLKKQTVYSVSKGAGEQLGRLYDNVTSIRPYSVYGPGEAAHRFIPTAIRCLATGESMLLDTEATHDWIYIGDFITALLAGCPEIGSGKKYTNLEIINILENISGKKLNYIAGKLRSYDNQNWICKNGVEHISIESGLRKCWEYYAKP